MGSPGRVAAATVAAVLLCAPAASAKARPDLVVAKGSVKVVATKASGTVVIANRGRARSARTTAALSLRAAGRWRPVARFTLPALTHGATRTLKLAGTLPGGLPSGALPLRVCADNGARVRESKESNNCRTVGTRAATTGPTPAPAPAPTPTPLPTPVPTPTPPTGLSRPASSVPANPFTFSKDVVFRRADDQGGYWIDVPASYDATHATPTSLFVWMHGCEGRDEDDVSTVAPTGRSYIAISPDGREGDCWYPTIDVPKVLSAIADVKTHFNVDPRRVVVGGYSSGGDLAYRAAFDNAYTFAGVLAINTSPFKDTGLTQQAAIGGAYWKFHVVHLAHTGDTTYPIAGVRAETDALTAAGFPATRVERPGNHYDDDTATSGTFHGLVGILLPHMDDGWPAPP